jgi:hypothetical protein
MIADTFRYALGMGALYGSAALLALIGIGAASDLVTRRERRERRVPYDWQVHGECTPRESHVRLLPGDD